MAEERQPPSVQEGDTSGEAVPAAAEDRKAADAMSKLDIRELDSSQKESVDSKALGDAIKGLDTAGSGNKKEISAGAKEATQKKEEVKKVVKVEASDVNLLIEHLDLTKAKATELLKAHDADPVKAMTAFVTTAA